MWLQNSHGTLAIVAMAALIIVSACGGPQNLVGVKTTVPVDSVPGITKHRLFIATSRARSDEPAEFYSGRRGSGLEFASVDVSVPPGHQTGKVERPKQLPANPQKHFVIESAEYMEGQQQFQKELASYLSTLPPSKRNLLLFVHGYNTNISSAILQVSQFVEDTGYDGVPLLFSWASSGQTVKYVYDINSALAARDHLVSMFSVLQIPTVQNYDIVAHSMGTFLVMEASRQVVLTTGLNPTGKVRNVVLAAPDIDIDLFRSQIALFPEKGRNIIVLVAKDDKALKASRRVAGGVTRLGQMPAEELSKLGVIAIDLSEIDDENSLSHSKFKDSPEVVQLLGGALKEGNTFDQRPNLSIGQAIAVGIDGTLETLNPLSK